MSDPNRESEDLVRRAQAGDRAAFDALMAEYESKVEALIRTRLGTKLRAHVEPRDLVQETFLRALRSLPRFEWSGEGSLYRWLRGIAINVIFEALKNTDRNRTIALEFEVLSEEPTPSRIAQRQERTARFEKAIQDLSPEHRDALRLVRLEGLSVNEVARRMGRSPNAVSHLLIRGLRKLREKFGETASLHLFEKPPGMDREDHV